MTPSDGSRQRHDRATVSSGEPSYDLTSAREEPHEEAADWLWPNGKRIAVVFNVCLEAWSDGKAPGISPMGNPLPAGVLDTMAISWAAYGVKTGIYRLLDAFERHRAKASVMVNAVIAERSPATVKAIADAGHEVLSHSYAMDVIPALLSDEDEPRTSSAAPRCWKRRRARKSSAGCRRAAPRSRRRRSSSRRPATAGMATCSIPTCLTS